MSTRVILILNAGSSSVKFALHDEEGRETIAHGAIEGIGTDPVLKLRNGTSRETAQPPSGQSGETSAMIDWLLEELDARLGLLEVSAAGHRVVHGGRDFDGPVLVDEDVLHRLEKFCPLAPGHEPFNLYGIRAVAAKWPSCPQVACFDTAFHRKRPRHTQTYAIPRALTEEGILRYGFHGLSYAHIAGRLPEVLGPERARGRVVVAHLGSGASLCAMRDGQSVDTTMGFSALDGLMMGTRCGDIDPGVLIHLMRSKGLDADDLEQLLSRESGLLGVSGISPDMRDLLGSTAPEAAEAVTLFVQMILRQVGAMAASLGGLDALVFTGGIGERSPQIRARVMEGLGWTGLVPGNAECGRDAAVISAPDSAVTAAMIPTDEESEILREVLGLRP